MGDCEEVAADLHPDTVILSYPDTVILPYGAGRLEKCFVVLKKKIWDADERRFSGFKIPPSTPVI